MADMPTDFWAGWIAVLTTVSVIGLAWLVFSIYFLANHQEQEDSPIWDQTLSEGKNPAPMWWFWMTLIALVITVIYLMLYPGLGSFSGTLKWSQHGRLEHSMHRYQARFSPIRKNLLTRPISDLQNNPAIMESAERIFVQNCAACHGLEGTGQAFAFPDLKDNDWQWGGSENAIMQTIKKGRQATMIGWQSIIGEEGVLQVADYVKTLAKNNSSELNAQGKKIFQDNCAACHGLLGEGNSALGAPNLTDEIWLYGNSDSALHRTIADGRVGIMPAFEKRLDEMQIRALTAYLLPKNENMASTTQAENNTKNSIKTVSVKIDDENGEKIYRQYCLSCHQENGEGVKGIFPSLVGNDVVLNADATEHINIVLHGLSNKIINGVIYTTPMPGFAAQLNDDEVVAVINYERSKWGNSASIITSDMVSAIR